MVTRPPFNVRFGLWQVAKTLAYIRVLNLEKNESTRDLFSRRKVIIMDHYGLAEC